MKEKKIISFELLTNMTANLLMVLIYAMIFKSDVVSNGDPNLLHRLFIVPLLLNSAVFMLTIMALFSKLTDSLALGIVGCVTQALTIAFLFDYYVLSKNFVWSWYFIFPMIVEWIILFHSIVMQIKLVKKVKNSVKL